MLKIGDTYSEEINYDQSFVKAFAELTGDPPPLHLDAVYAATPPFKKPIMHGMISGGVMSIIFATKLPGTGSIFLSPNMQFKRPMFAGVTYRVEVTVIEINTAKHIGKLKAEVLDKAIGKVCLYTEATLMNDKQF
jgi:acyl dehydratase